MPNEFIPFQQTSDFAAKNDLYTIDAAFTIDPLSTTIQANRLFLGQDKGFYECNFVIPDVRYKLEHNLKDSFRGSAAFVAITKDGTASQGGLACNT